VGFQLFCWPGDDGFSDDDGARTITVKYYYGAATKLKTNELQNKCYSTILLQFIISAVFKHRKINRKRLGNVYYFVVSPSHHTVYIILSMADGIRKQKTNGRVSDRNRNDASSDDRPSKYIIIYFNSSTSRRDF